MGRGEGEWVGGFGRRGGRRRGGKGGDSECFLSYIYEWFFCCGGAAQRSRTPCYISPGASRYLNAEKCMRICIDRNTDWPLMDWLILKYTHARAPAHTHTHCHTHTQTFLQSTEMVEVTHKKLLSPGNATMCDYVLVVVTMHLPL